MKVVTRMLQKEIMAAVAMTTSAFLALLMFFDLISESRFASRAGADSYGITDALAHLAFSAPMHVYELMPICVLIGTVFVMARYAKTSQFTILRTAGLGPSRALGILLTIGAVFTGLTFVVGDYVAPWAERSAQLLRAQHVGGQIVAGGGTGAWLRERQGDHSVIVSVAALQTDGEVVGIRIFEYDRDGRLARQIHANSAQVDSGAWLLEQAREEVLPVTSATPVRESDGSLTGTMESLRVTQYPQLRWETSMNREMINAAILKPDGMSTLQLANYVSHLKANDQSTQRFELELWRKVFYPLGCLVMMVLALPFAYLHFRSGGIMGYVFVGILVGISYLLMNNVLGYVGNIRGWSPLLTAATPALVYSALALGVFTHMVRQR
ncbi:LPS export ABC transporter permease LptG [Lampropedia puyangensis]|uniref:LPS export ABC transporter permease LptG n=1 Tax=Lampropedia puyangensis TaxID=1330072 RepID=A0A4V4GS64_9BURK|nr:LPS export ABC transporter permease LptG [Lampropedia puyangensis]THU04456.1 LPS export ABC transporter permease LptG [Lampropedia puyangensis]